MLGQRGAQAPDPLDRFRHELLAAVAGMDAHAEHEVGVRRDGGDVLRLALGVERDADLEAVLARGGDRRGHVVDDLVVEGDAVAAGAGDLREVAQRVVDHQVAVEHAARLVDERRDRLEHDGPDRDRLDEVAVADVEVEDAAAGVAGARRSARRAARSPPRRATARSRVPHPVAPGHARHDDRMAFAPDGSAEAGDEEAARAVDVREREQELGPRRVRELPATPPPSGRMRRPLASTTASHSSGFSVQTE